MNIQESNAHIENAMKCLELARRSLGVEISDYPNDGKAYEQWHRAHQQLSASFTCAREARTIIGAL